MNNRSRQKRGVDHNWQVVKYNGDTALYARCKCDYRYCCAKTYYENGKFITKITWLSNYCPNCGARKKWYNEDPIRVHKFPWE